jgi:acyl carrier protein
MKMEEIQERVSSYIIDTAYIEKSKIKEDTLIFQEGIFDSMGFVMLLGFLEESFNVKPNDAELIEENFESIKAITKYIAHKKVA